jgi:uncharacterized membrane protein
MYFLPSVLNSLGVISAEKSRLYYVASQFLLPACLVLLTLSIDFKGIAALGKKAVIMFLTGTAGVMIGGPVAILAGKVLFPELFAGTADMEVWRGFSTIAGSWIGGGANQTAMYEVFKPAPDLFSVMLSVDILVANVWMGALLFFSGKASGIDARAKADVSSIETLRHTTEAWQKTINRIATTTDLVKLLVVGFGITGLSHLLADILAPWFKEHVAFASSMSLDSTFFWVVVLATTGGLLLSFTSLKNLEGAGASKIGSVFIYILVAAIGMKMDVTAVVRYPAFFVLGIVWMAVHGGLMLVVARIIKAPLFFTAVGSMANIGGAASAPVMASAFHPSLAPVGVLLAVLGYALGTYGGYICALIMRAVS